MLLHMIAYNGADTSTLSSFMLSNKKDIDFPISDPTESVVSLAVLL